MPHHRLLNDGRSFQSSPSSTYYRTPQRRSSSSPPRQAPPRTLDLPESSIHPFVESLPSSRTWEHGTLLSDLLNSTLSPSPEVPSTHLMVHHPGSCIARCVWPLRELLMISSGRSLTSLPTTAAYDELHPSLPPEFTPFLI